MPRIDAVTLKQLRALRSVAELGSLTSAADRLGLTPPAIHSQIRNLEVAIGHEALTRSGEGGRLKLTPEGEDMLLAAERIESILSQAASTIRARSSGKIGHVTLSVVSTAKYFAPGLVRDLQRSHPEVETTLRVGNREMVVADLQLGRCDLAIMGRPPRQPEVRAVPLGPHPHGVILPPAHPLAAQDGFDPAALAAETFLAREEGSGTRILMQRLLDQFVQGQPVRMLEMDSNETIKQAVLAGLGIAFLSLHTVCEEMRTGRLVALKGRGLPVMRHWYLVTPLHSPVSPVAARVEAAIAAMNGTFLPRVPVSE